MKKAKTWIWCAVILSLVTVMVCPLLCPLFMIGPDAPVTIHYEDHKTNITQILPADEARMVYNIISGHTYELFGDGAGCPLNEKCTITVCSRSFAYAQDGCGTIMLLGHPSKLIVDLTADEISFIENLYRKYYQAPL